MPDIETFQNESWKVNNRKQNAEIRIRKRENGMSCVAIITARGGSRRIPRKNIKEFCGKPIISYSIAAALESGIFDEVVVSTDDAEIARIARENGAEVPFLRSAGTSGDFATTADVIEEVITNLKKIGKEYDSFCCLYPTAPFVTAQKLNSALRLLEESGADSVLPVVRFSFPPQRGIIIKDGKAAYAMPQYASARSQDLTPVYHDCGQFYFCRTDAFLKYHSLVTENTVPLEVPDEEVQDIDNLSDWHLAELKYKAFILDERRV